MTRFNKYQKLAMVALPLAIALNPLVVQIFLEYILWLFTGISVAATLYIIGFTLYNMFKIEKVNIPKKAKKTTPQFIET